MDVKKIAKRYRNKYQSNPFEMAKALDIHVIVSDLGDISGLFKVIKRIKFIFINSRLSDEMKRYTLAHELGHAILHKGVDTLFYMKQAPRNEIMIEREADEFATWYLIDGSHDQYAITSKHQIIQYYELPINALNYI